MSTHVTNVVWKLPIPMSEKIVLLKLGDCAGDDGENVFPKQSTVARECGCSTRHVQRVVKASIDRGWMRELPSLPTLANRYEFDMDAMRQAVVATHSRSDTQSSRLPVARVATLSRITEPPKTRQKKTPLTGVKRKVPGLEEPNLDECRAYAVELRMPEGQGSAFLDHFSANGWRVGTGSGKPMKDWQAAMRTWKRNFVKFGGQLTVPKLEVKPAEETVGQTSAPPPPTPEEFEAMRADAKRRLGIDAAEGEDPGPEAADRSGLFVVRGGLILEIQDEFEAMGDERVFRSMSEVKDAVRKAGKR